MKYKLKLCPLAKKHHQESTRSFAHVFHLPKTICLTPEFYNLPQGYQLGILVHEFGHLALGRKQHTEEAADRRGSLIANALVIRKTYRGMKNLEYIRRQDTKKAWEFLDRFISDEPLSVL